MNGKKLNILFLLASVWSFAQVNLYSEVNTKEVRVNSPIIFTIVLEVVGEDFEQETPIKLPDFSKFNFDISSEQNTLLDPVKRIRINQQIFQLYLEPKQAGNLKVGSATVKINGKWYKTEPIDIVVKDSERKVQANNTPTRNMHLNMHIENKEVFKNEPVIGVVKAFGKNISSFRNLENPIVEKEKNVASFPIKNIDEPIEEDIDISSQVVAMYVFIPKITGLIEMPSAEISTGANRKNLVSNKVKVNVRKLPEGAPSHYSNAVGDFELDLELIDKKKENFEINKAFHVSLKLSGKGNLSPSILPKLKPSDAYETYEPKIVNNSYATTKGLEGEIEAHYVIIPKKRGDIVISTEDFSFFDPKEESYVDIGVKSITLKTLTAEDIAKAKTALQKVNDYTNIVLDNVDSPVISTESLKTESHKNINWFIIFTNLGLILIGGLTFFYFNKRFKEQKEKNRLQKIKDQTPIVNIAETEEFIRKEIAFDIDSHYDYLQNIINGKLDANFIVGVESLLTDTNQYCKTHYQKSFFSYLESNFDPSVTEKYHQLITKINIEKYSPFTSAESQLEIITDLKTLLDLI